MTSGLTTADRKRVLKLAAGGLPPRIIRDRLACSGVDIDDHTIHNILAGARRSGAKLPRFRAPSDPSRAEPLIRFTLDAGNLATLGAEARKRGLSPSQLARRLISAVIADNIVDAVLDDRTEAV